MITTSIIEGPLPQRGYPCLKRSLGTGCIVLFTERNKGIVVHNAGEGGMSEGTFTDCWNEEGFEHFDGRVTLENS
jgi:hypothetical protein